MVSDPMSRLLCVWSCVRSVRNTPIFSCGTQRYIDSCDGLPRVPHHACQGGPAIRMDLGVEPAIPRECRSARVPLPAAVSQHHHAVSRTTRRRMQPISKDTVYPQAHRLGLSSAAGTFEYESYLWQPSSSLCFFLKAEKRFEHCSIYQRHSIVPAYQ